MHFTNVDTDSLAGATIFLDVDGTLVPDTAETLSPDTERVLRTLSARARIIFASNGSGVRSQRLAEQFGTDALPTLHKPFVSANARALCGAHTVVIGDRYLADGLFALMLGAAFVKVDSIRADNDPLRAHVAYFLDALVGRAVYSLARLFV